MFTNQYFYHKLTRKYVVLFGNMFNDIEIRRINKSSNDEIERFRVPLVYAGKEKYIERLRADPDLDKAIQNQLPRMAFSMVGIDYVAEKQQMNTIRHAKANTSTGVATQYIGVPYDINFELYIYARNIDDGTHIIEQILPYFTPSYTIPALLIPEIGIQKDIIVLLNGLSNSVEFEGSNDATRFVMWTLSFTMHGYYFGPVSTPKIIRKVITNIYNDPSLTLGYVVNINTENGNNGTFNVDDLVYQGATQSTATAYGIVSNWSANNGTLQLVGVQGTFGINKTIRASSTNATYNIASFDANPIKLVNITIEPDPITADPDDDYGFSTSIVEWPNT